MSSSKPIHDMLAGAGGALLIKKAMSWHAASRGDRRIPASHGVRTKKGKTRMTGGACGNNSGVAERMAE